MADGCFIPTVGRNTKNPILSTTTTLVPLRTFHLPRARATLTKPAVNPKCSIFSTTTLDLDEIFGFRKLRIESYQSILVARILAAGKKWILLSEKKRILPPCGPLLFCGAIQKKTDSTRIHFVLDDRDSWVPFHVLFVLLGPRKACIC